MNFNAKAYNLDGADWCEKNGIKYRVFDNFDGGGWNHYIFEFSTREDLEAFCQNVSVPGVKWIEHDDGSTERL